MGWTVTAFGEGDPLDRVGAFAQVRYLRGYLRAIGARSVLEEDPYFDRDYLSEFVAFYATSPRGYSNRCKRLHFFSDERVDDALLVRANDGDTDAIAVLRDAYLGFVVVRPLPHAPLGRTVLRPYPQDATGARVTDPVRVYRVHLPAAELSVEGVAWQQQDSAVGACATVALWSMFQSSAFDEQHAIPSTAEITVAANQPGVAVGRTFPSGGLSLGQIIHAIRAAGLEPVLGGDRPASFRATIGMLIRSGFPVLLAAGCEDTSEHHAVCVAGFRNPGSVTIVPGAVSLADDAVSVLYVHDDNLGPYVRYEVETVAAKEKVPAQIRLTARPPGNKLHEGDPTSGSIPLVGPVAAAAVPENLRAAPGAVLDSARVLTASILAWLAAATPKRAATQDLGLALTARYVRVGRYLSAMLPAAVPPGKSALGRLRRAFAAHVEAPSLFLAVVRVTSQRGPLFDIVYDTSDGDGHLRPWAIVAFSRWVADEIRALRESEPLIPVVVDPFTDRS